MVSHRLLLLCSLFACWSLTLIHSSTSDLTWPPRSASSPYYPERGLYQQRNFFLNIISTNSSMSGNMVCSISYFGQQFGITGQLNNVPYYQSEVVLPHESDDLFGCADGFHTQNEFNETFNGKAVLLRQGNCQEGLAAQRAQAMGGSVSILGGCSTDAPYNCDPNLVPLVSSVSLGIPAIGITPADNFLIYAYLVARRLARKAAMLVPSLAGDIPPPLFMRIISTGPMVPDELAAIKNLALHTRISQDTTSRSPLGNLPTFNLNFAQNATADPCLQRLAGLWCENGHLVGLDLPRMDWEDISPAVSGLAFLGTCTHIRVLRIPQNRFIGPIPTSWCKMTDLRYLIVYGQMTGEYDGFSSLPLCMNAMPLLEFLSAGNNALTDPMPDFVNNTLLGFLDLRINRYTTLPSSFPEWKFLEMFDISGNQLHTLPNITGFTKLTGLYMGSNALENELQPYHFSDCPLLDGINLSGNKLYGTLPHFSGTPALTGIDVSENQISGTIPMSWVTNLPNLDYLDVHQNRLVSPVAHLSQMSLLKYIDLSHNLLTLVVPNQPSGDFGVFWPAGPATETLKLDWNLLSGIWSDTFSLHTSIITLSLSHNQIQNLPSILFTEQFWKLQYFDASFNSISRWLIVDAPPVSWQYMNLEGNPNLRFDSTPSWIRVGTRMLLDSSQKFLCPELGSLRSVTTKLILDPEFSNYDGCICAKGTFGVTPRCYEIPLVAKISSSSTQITSSEVGADFRDLIELTSGRPPQNDTQNNSTIGPLKSFSVAWYGQTRLTPGVSTNWLIDLSNVTDPISRTPVRMITLYLHLNLRLFKNPTDVISIYEGDSSLRIGVLRGNNPPPTISEVPYTATTEYRTTYALEFAQIGNLTALWEVQVFTPLATVQFTSRDETGTHFFASYQESFECPDGYFFDTTFQRCRPNLIEYDVSLAARIVVFVVSAFAILLQLVFFAVVIRGFDTPLIRAASRWFILLILIFFMMLSAGAILYAIIPNASRHGRHNADVLCESRGWLTVWPLTGILGVLLAKTNRINELFSQSNTLTTRVITDTDILITVMAVLAGSSVLLGVFSGMPLTAAFSGEGNGSYTNEMIHECTMNAGFGPWISVMLAFIAILLLAATYLSFKTKDLPSRFNESTHIMNSVILCLVYGCLVVPLAFLIRNNPDASIIIQGVGQALGSILLSAAIFIPKVYFLIAGGDRGLIWNGGNSGQHGSGSSNPGITGNSAGSKKLPIHSPLSASSSPPSVGRGVQMASHAIPVAVNPNKKDQAGSTESTPGSPPSIASSLRQSPAMASSPSGLNPQQSNQLSI